MILTIAARREGGTQRPAVARTAILPVSGPTAAQIHRARLVERGAQQTCAEKRHIPFIGHRKRADSGLMVLWRPKGHGGNRLRHYFKLSAVSYQLWLIADG